MKAIKLEQHQIIRIGKYPAPKVDGYNSLFFHPLTKGYDTETYIEWGKILSRMCEDCDFTYYYFYNDYDTKINVYPNELIKDWWEERNG